jgi:hypothetical protein
MNTNRFALIYGIAFLIVGVAGFVPGITTPHTHPEITAQSGLGLLFGLFPVNLLHNIVHILFGIWGLFAMRSLGGAPSRKRSASHRRWMDPPRIRSRMCCPTAARRQPFINGCASRSSPRRIARISSAVSWRLLTIPGSSPCDVARHCTVAHSVSAWNFSAGLSSARRAAAN